MEPIGKFILYIIPEACAIGRGQMLSSSWLVGSDKCYWPDHGNQRKLARQHAAVDENWTLWACRILRTSGVHFTINHYR